MCPVCGAVVTRGPRAVYCSRRCVAKATHRRATGKPLSGVPRACPVCLAAVPKSRTAKAIYCSPECASLAASRHRRHKPVANPPGTRNCHVCGKQIEQPPHRSEVKYCSVSCRTRATQRKRAGLPVANPNRVCPHCGGSVDPLKPVTAIYCSKKCASAAAVKRHQRSKHDQWRARANARTRALKERVIAAYGGACECCGADDVDVLSIDHINSDGRQHRQSLGGLSLYRWLEKNDFPLEGFRLLCMNCNWGRFHNSDVCPHEATIPLPNSGCVFCGGELDTRMAACTTCQRQLMKKYGTLSLTNCVLCGATLPRRIGRANSGQRYFCSTCALERRKSVARAWVRRQRLEAIRIYGGRCVECGEREPLFLTIDHVAGDGAAHRREVGAGPRFYKWLERENYPSGFQVLCMNCNWKKGTKRGEEPVISGSLPLSNESANPDEDYSTRQ